MATTTSSTSVDNAVDEAKDTAKDLKNKAESAATDKLAHGKDQAAGVLDDVAEALHDTSDSLRDHHQDAFAQFADSAASQVEAFTQAIRGRNVGELLDEAERFARRDSGLFIGGAFLLGIAGARFLKASAPTSSRSFRSGTSSGNAFGSPRPAFSGQSWESGTRTEASRPTTLTTETTMRGPSPSETRSEPLTAGDGGPSTS